MWDLLFKFLSETKESIIEITAITIIITQIFIVKK